MQHCILPLKRRSCKALRKHDMRFCHTTKFKYYIISNFMELSYSKTSECFMEPEGSLLRLEGPPLVPVLRPINPVYSAPSYLRSTLILFTHLRLGLPSGPFASGFPTKILYEFLFTPFVLHTLPITSVTGLLCVWQTVKVFKLILMQF
jgi:hypothetical protein